MAIARVCEFCNTRFRSAKSKPICPSCGKRQQVERRTLSGASATDTPQPAKGGAAASVTMPSKIDWVIAIVGVAGVIVSIVAAVIGVLLLFFVGVGMLLGAFAVQRLLRLLKPAAS